MEEVADEIPEKLENEEEVEDIVPEPPPLQRQSNPARKPVEKVTCSGCGKTMAASTYKYSHKCKARAPEEEPAPVEKPKKRIDRGKLAEALKDEKPSMTKKQSMRPVKNRAVIGRTEYVQPEPPYQPNQQEIYSHLLHQRQQQAYMRHQAMLQPYQQMFAMRAQ